MKRRILIVEDSPTQAEHLRLFLEGEGYQVDAASNGREGLERIQLVAPELIISDVMMPEMDGYAFCQAVKANPQTKRIPFVLLTQRKSPTDIIWGLERGADNFITKPFDDDYLLERVRRIFEHLALREKGRLEVDVTLRVAGRDITINPDKQQIIELLLSTFEDLCRANEQLEEANRELEAFTYSVSHDLRAPLRRIDGFTRILVEELGPGLDQTVRHYLENVQEGARHMGALVDDLLHLSRVGRQQLNTHLTSLNSLVDEVVRDLQSETEAREIEWRIGQLPVVICDPGLMRQVFANLVANAVKFTGTRQHAVIEIGHKNADSQSVIFVRDNGVGFNMKYADKLFGVFQRLHRQEDFEGTGVGLATVQRIIHKHGGRIWAEAEPDRGATFCFALRTPAKSSTKINQE